MATSRSVGRLTAQSDVASSNRRPVLLVIATIIGNILAFMILFQAYKLVRKSFIQRAEDVGYGHAEQIISLQKHLHIFFEVDLQRWMLNHEWAIRSLNWYYAGFMWAFYACCVMGIVFAPERYRYLRRVFILSMILALPWYAIYPLAPPRFMTDHGFVDTLKIFGPNYFDNGGLVTANQFAAMPSMHIGWTTIGAFMLAAAIPYRRIGTILAVLHVGLMTLTVMATGNHYLLDAVGGWIIVGAAFLVASKFPAQLPFPRFRSTPAPAPQPVLATRPVPAARPVKPISVR